MSSTPTPAQLKRKLPIKRKPPVLALTPKSEPNPPTTPTATTTTATTSDDDDDLTDPSPDQSHHATSSSPPFKFHRIWSEPDEIRFLQGLLACFSQNLLFPRDLNLFYDRFSESMPQPYTRSQLSEKLRRLRKKFRVMSARIARGQDPARLAPHDRDLLHLSTRLWHPSYAATSPFSAAEPGDSGSSGNKRRRPNPRGPSGPPVQVMEAPVLVGQPEIVLMDVKEEILGHVDSEPIIDDVNIEIEERGAEGVPSGFVKEEVAVGGKGAGSPASGVDGLSGLVARAVLDVFDGCVKEAHATLAGQCESEGDARSGLERRWREQRIAEMDLVVRRMRLVVENGVRE